MVNTKRSPNFLGLFYIDLKIDYTTCKSDTTTKP